MFVRAQQGVRRRSVAAHRSRCLGEVRKGGMYYPKQAARNRIDARSTRARQRALREVVMTLARGATPVPGPCE